MKFLHLISRQVAIEVGLKYYFTGLACKNPLSKGGSNWPDNIQLLCPDCNFRKGAKDYKDWIESNGIIN